MKKVFINGMSSIGAQATFEGFDKTDFIENQEAFVLPIQHPSYKELIAPAAIRRMAKGVKMGIFTAHHALEEAGNPTLDAIIVGTGIGCIEDSEKFLNAIIDNNEEFLTPTSFIQSTHNTVAGQIALEKGCKAYNFTYVNGVVSFETALIDALLQIQLEDKKSVLVGGVDETAKDTMQIYTTVERIKSFRDPEDFHFPVSKGVVYAEGATFFSLESDHKENSYAELVDVLAVTDLNESILSGFLNQHQLSTSDMDLVFLGIDGSTQNQPNYLKFESYFENANFAMTKQFSGHFHTASAFTMWVAVNSLKNQEVKPEFLRKSKPVEAIKHVLIYNYDQGNHALILLRAC